MPGAPASAGLDRVWRGWRKLGADIERGRPSGPSGGPANVAKVTMPQLGESVAEGTIGKWLKQPGDHVAKYEPLLEVITDKVNAEVPVAVRGRPHRDPRPGGRYGPQRRRDRGHRHGRRRARHPAATGPVVTSAPATPEPAHGPAGSDERPVAPSPAPPRRPRRLPPHPHRSPPRPHSRRPPSSPRTATRTRA